jgi:hypothetical protein
MQQFRTSRVSIRVRHNVQLGGIHFLCLSRPAKSFTFRARLGLHEMRRTNDNQ